MNAVFAPLPRYARVLAIVSLVLQVAIVGTGGAVRLTGSGLGCPTWPLCTDDSLVATQEMGIHGAIEFGNRLLSIVVGFVAVALVLVLLRLRKQHRGLLPLAIAVLAGTVLQGFIGGISVRVRLDPSVVGLHFLLSAILVALSAALVYRVVAGPRGGHHVAPAALRVLAYVTAALVVVTIIVGILTTGAGPHAGDAASDRNGLDPGILQHVHSWPAYATLAATLALLIGVLRLKNRRLIILTGVLLLVEAIQVLVGLAQARLGLPPLLVGIHMVLACCLGAAMTAVVLSLRGDRPAT